MSDQRTAPVQRRGSRSKGRIPWAVHVRAWQTYAAEGHRSQSAARIAERGGFGEWELVCYLADHGHGDGTMRPLNERQAAALTRLRAEGAEA